MTNLTTKTLYAMLGIAALALSFLPAAQAQQPASDSLIVYDAAGNIVASISAPETEDPTHLYLINDPTLADPSQFHNATTLIESPNTPSDVFGVAADPNGTFLLAFLSDGDPGATVLGTGPTHPEGTGVFDATMYLSSSLRASGHTATFTSDPAPVPDGGTTCSLFGLALTGLTFLRRKLC